MWSVVGRSYLPSVEDAEVAGVLEGVQQVHHREEDAAQALRDRPARGGRAGGSIRLAAAPLTSVEGGREAPGCCLPYPDVDLLVQLSAHVQVHHLGGAVHLIDSSSKERGSHRSAVASATSGCVCGRGWLVAGPYLPTCVVYLAMRSSSSLLWAAFVKGTGPVGFMSYTQQQAPSMRSGRQAGSAIGR